MTHCYVNRAALPELGGRLTYCRFPKSSSRFGSVTADLDLCYSITNHDYDHVAFRRFDQKQANGSPRERLDAAAGIGSASRNPQIGEEKLGRNLWKIVVIFAPESRLEITDREGIQRKLFHLVNNVPFSLP